MDNAVTFTVTLGDMLDTQRLAIRKYALGTAVAVLLVGLGLAAFNLVPGLVVIGLGALVVAAWRFPLTDRWLIRRRAAARIGATCEVWLDAYGIPYRQAGLNGHIAWSAITKIIEDDRSLIFMQGGLALMAIPKRAFESPEATARFLRTVREASDRATTTCRVSS